MVHHFEIDGAPACGAPRKGAWMVDVVTRSNCNKCLEIGGLTPIGLSVITLEEAQAELVDALCKIPLDKRRGACEDALKLLGVK